MPTPARNTSLKLRTDIATQAPRRAASLNLTFSAYVAILVWNQVQAPKPLEAEADSPRSVRVNVPCYLRREVAPLLRSVASSSKLSENAAAESLIARDLRTGGPSLTILARK